MVETIETDDFSDVDKTVKRYMVKYGIDNVRGGTYSAAVLPDYMMKTLTEEMKYLHSGPFKQLILGDQLYRFTKTMRDWGDIEGISSEVKANENRLLRYTLEKQAYLDFYNAAEMSMNVLDDISWLKLQISANYEIVKHDMNNNKRIRAPDPSVSIKYRKIIARLKNLSELYFKIKDTVDYMPKIHLSHPEFVFDNFICHFSKHMFDVSNEPVEFIKEGVEEHPSVLEKILPLCGVFEYMYYCVKNHLDCLEYDVTSYGEYFEEVSHIKKRVLQSRSF